MIKTHPYNSYLKTTIVWVSLLLFYPAYSQKNNCVKEIINLNISIDKRIQQVDSILVVEEKNKDIHILYQEYSEWLFKNKELDKAIVFRERAIKVVRTKAILDSLFLQTNNLYLGYYYKLKNEFRNSIIAYENSLKYGVNRMLTFKTHQNLGNVYKRTHDYIKSMDHYQVALEIVKQDSLSKFYKRDLAYNMSLTYLQIHDKKNQIKGLRYAHIADSLSNKTNTNLNYLYEIKRNLALYYSRHLLLDILKSHKYYQQALSIAIEQKNNQKISQTLLWIGNLYNTINLNKSIDYLKQSLAYTSNSETHQLYNIYYNYFLAYTFNGKYKKSIVFADKSLKFLTGNDFLNDLKDYDLLELQKHKRSLRFILPDVAETYLKLYEITQDSTYLEKSIDLFRISDHVIDLLSIDSKEFRSKIFWKKISTDLYAKAIKACYLNKDMEQVFYYMEKNKALLLMEDIATQNYRKSLLVDPILLEKETELKKKLFILRSNKRRISQETDLIDKDQIDLELQLKVFQDSIYHDKNRQIEPTILSLNTVKKSIKEDELLIEYHISIDDGYGIYTNNQNAYALFITKNNTQLFEIPDQPQLKKQITQLTQLIAKPFTTTKSSNRFIELSNQVYTILFPTKEIRELTKGKKLKIIADNYLGSLPFEVLITEKETTDYLIESNEISYDYSFSFSKQNKELIRNPKQDFIGFAPVTFNNDTLATLYHSEKEIIQINKITNGELFIKEKATKTHFLEKMNQAKIIHLATHAESNDRVSPWIAFKDSILYLEELSLTHNQSDLTVLSACNTSTGEIVTGEGVLSLARGFFLSGTKSVVSSLWSTDDKATGYITENFYSYLKKGETKSSALRKAKLKYLKNHSKSLQSPFYWSPLILIGDTDPIAFKPDYTWVVYSISLLIFFVLSFLVWKFSSVYLSKRKNNLLDLK